MQALSTALDTFFSFKAYVMLPIIIFLLGVVIRMKVKDALLSALKVAVGFAGIFIIFGFFVGAIGPAIEAIIARRGLDYPVLDVGWPPLAAITWASTIAPLSIPLVIVINLVLLAAGATKTVNIDVWNYWHFALVGALLQQTTGSLALGLAATAIIAVFAIKMADWSAPLVERVAGLKGICITTLSANGLYPVGVLGNAVLERLPLIRRVNWNPQERKTGVGILGEPMIIGVVIGLFLGLLAKYSLRPLLELCVHIAAVMFLLPHCGTLIGKGMEPVSLQLKRVVQRIFPNKKDLFVGMDGGVLMGSNSVIVTGLVLMPIALVLAFVVPGNRTIPLGDLANLIPVMSVIVLSVRGNVFRAVLIGIPIVIGYLHIATNLAPLFTRLSARVGVETEGGYSGLITAFTDGGNPIRFWFYHMFRGDLVALLMVVPAAVLLFLTWRIYRRWMS
jgi:PTS system galactitol-specific IIC component